jgi:uncharacterized small protein (DUF1192 family)
MARFDEDGRPIKAAAHQVGQDLSQLSEADLEERLSQLHEEVARIEAERLKRNSTRAAADAFFKLK